MPMTSTPSRRVLLLALVGGFAAGSAAAEPPDPGAFPWMGGRIGVSVQSLSPELREHFGAPADRGVLVARVESGRPAKRAGVRVGDVLLSANDEPLRQPGDLLRIVWSLPRGATLELRLLRDGKERSVQVAPEGDAEPYLAPDAWHGWQRWLDRGLRQGSRELRERLEELERRLEELEKRLDAEEGAGTKPT